MKILLNNNDLNEALSKVHNLGFVPTMGSLHKGHISLIKRSKKECNKTIVSIFVNPKQFNNKNDFKKYPRNQKKDLIILKKLNVNFVFIPNINQIYHTKKITNIKIGKKNQILCAKFRKGHFEGVIKVMDRLTALIKPKKIFMGEKDYQQFYLVKKYLNKKYSSKIIQCKTIRDKNKIALSSRNLLLDKKNLFKAGKFIKDLMNLKNKYSKYNSFNKMLDLKKKEFSKLYKIKIEYLELRNLNNLKLSKKIKNSKIFVAFYLNKVRLIDNI